MKTGKGIILYLCCIFCFCFLANPGFANEAMKKHLASIGEDMEKIPRARISSLYGMRTLGKTTRFHSGIDIAVAGGTGVTPFLSGIVLKAGWYSSYGLMVEIYHGQGVTTRYAHLSAVRTELGKYVKKGTVIGNVGSTGKSTGNHLHFEIRLKGKAIDPMILQKRSRQLALEFYKETVCER